MKNELLQVLSLILEYRSFFWKVSKSWGEEKRFEVFALINVYK